MKKNLSPKKPETQEVPLKVPPPAQKHPPWIALPRTLHKLSIFKNGNILRLWHELADSAPNYKRTEVVDNEYIELEPWQGVFKGVIFSHRLRLDRRTLWIFMRRLKKAKILTRKVYPHYSIYTFTDKGIIKLSKKAIDTEETGLVPPSTPLRGPQVKSKVKSNSIINKVQSLAAPKDYRILFNKTDYNQLKRKLLFPDKFPCLRLDFGLPDNTRRWLVVGICAANSRINNGDCKLARNFCLPHLRTLSNKLQGHAIRSPQSYILATINDYFYPKGGD